MRTKHKDLGLYDLLERLQQKNLLPDLHPQPRKWDLCPSNLGKFFQVVDEIQRANGVEVWRYEEFRKAN